MAYQYDWEDLGSSHGELFQHDQYVDYQTNLSPGAQRILEDVYPSPREASLAAAQTNLNVATSRSWFQTQHTGEFGGGDAYHLSDHSDHNYATAPLPPLGPVSVQSDTQYNSGWLEGRSESIADSGFFSNPSVAPNTHQYLGSSDYSTPSISLHTATGLSLDAFSEQVQQPPLLDIGADIAPWYPGSRSTQLDQPGHFLDPTYNPTSSDHFTHDAIKDEHTYSISERSHPATVSDSLEPSTVLSDAAESRRSHARHPSVHSQDEVTACKHCHAEFTGRYRKGNCARHIRQQHSKKDTQLSTDCICRVCKQHFKRQDARRKHEWKKHRLQDTKPLPRRQAASLQNDSPHVGTHEMKSDQGTLTCTHTLLDEPAINMNYSVPLPTHRAHHIFFTARAKLNDANYNFYCKISLARCERMVKELAHGEPDLSHIFAQEMQILAMQLLPQIHKFPDSNSIAEGDLVDAQNNNDPDHEDTGSVHQDRGKAPVSRRTSRASSRFNPFSGRPPKSSSADPITAIVESFRKPKHQELDCPIHKWHLMHANEGTASPCNGCGKPYMNGVRQHLLPTYSQQHRGKISFIQRCDTCKEDFIDESLWNEGGHGADTCLARSQPQGNSLVCWARLFLKIYPDEVRVPSPYRNDSRCLPTDLVIWLREDLGLSRSVSTNDTHDSQHRPVPPPTIGNLALPHDGSGSSNHAARFQWFEAQLERHATVDTLVSRGSELLVQVLAQEYAEAAHDNCNIEDIKAYYRTCLQELRRSALAQVNPTQHLPIRTANQAVSSPSTPHQAQTPVIGGAADFPMPCYQPNPFFGMVQVPDSDMGTQPSSQEYHNGAASFDFPSLLASSSRTSYDFGNTTHMDASPTSGTQFYTPAEPTDCSPLSHNRDQWLPTYDDYLDIPGSSRMPQLLADAQMYSDIDRTMEPSASQSHYAPSHIDEDDAQQSEYNAQQSDDDTQLSDVD